MLTREEDIDAHALRRQGWEIFGDARHLRRDGKTIRAYPAGECGGRGTQAAANPQLYVGYVRARLTEDPHLWA